LSGYFLEGAVLPDNSLSVPILGVTLGILRAGTEGSHVRLGLHLLCDA